VLISISAEHRGDGDLRAIERDAGSHVGRVAEAFDQREDIVGIVARLIYFAGSEEAEIGEIDVPIKKEPHHRIGGRHRVRMGEGNLFIGIGARFAIGLGPMGIDVVADSLDGFGGLHGVGFEEGRRARQARRKTEKDEV